jgi:DNA polymerase
VTELKTHIDFETRSLAELARQNAVGEHAYAAHPSTDPLLLAYKTPDMPYVKVQNLLKDQSFPIELDLALSRGDRFVAHNARFEQAIWYWQMVQRFKWPAIHKWSCTAASSDLEVQHQKNKRGAELIKIFCVPRKRVKGVVKQMWAEPEELPNEWEEFTQYCGDDVLAEMDVDALLPELPPFEQAIWDLDYKINWRGLPIDHELVDRATMFCDYYTQMNLARFEAITGGLAPTQRDRVLEYVQQREVEIDNLRSKTLKRLNLSDLPSDMREIIQIRLESAKASVKKLQAMYRCTTEDGRARGLLLYYGAHTGRYSGKRIQPQNFTRGNAEAQRCMFQFLEDENIWDVTKYKSNSGFDLPPWVNIADLTFPRPLGSLAASMRGFIKAPEGQRFIVADYAQIEARVLAWLARAERKLEAFRTGKDLYCQFAAVMYGRNYDDYFKTVDGKRKVKKGVFADERQIAKSAELGCGYGLGGTAFVAYCDNMDIIIAENEAKQVVRTWRGDNTEIVDYWARIEKAAIIATTFEDRLVRVGDVSFRVYRVDEQRWWLECILPSGRHIAYFRPKVQEVTTWGGKTRNELSFRTEWNGMTYRESTYGGKLVENIVQGIARDIMMCGIQNGERNGYECVLTVHDENVTLRDIGQGSSHELERLMCDLPAWVGDCPITAEGGEMVRYGK